MYKLPRGTRDFTPEEMYNRRYIEGIMWSTFQTFGYREIQTPIFENMELFTTKSGDEILKEIYAFTDKSDRNLALRPELTAPVIRFYLDQLHMRAKPLKLFYFGNCFRYDRPQRGRYREFRQAGCELIGTDTPEALAELIALAYNLLQKVGLQQIQLNIGNLDILSAIFKILKIPDDQQKQLLSVIDKEDIDEITSILSGLGFSKENINRFVKFIQAPDIKDISDFIKEDNQAINELYKLKKMLNLLETAFNIKNYQLKMGIVRGLDYYKGIVFEIDAPVLGAEKQLCGGGSYELIPLFGGKATPTAGFALGFDRTILALEAEKFQLPKQTLDAYLIPIDENFILKSFEIAQKLRKNGVLTDVDLLRRGLNKSLKYANAIGVKKVVLVGLKEVPQDAVKVRDMHSGLQEVVKINDLQHKIT